MALSSVSFNGGVVEMGTFASECTFQFGLGVTAQLHTRVKPPPSVSIS